MSCKGRADVQDISGLFYLTALKPSAQLNLFGLGVPICEGPSGAGFPALTIFPSSKPRRVRPESQNRGLLYRVHQDNNSLLYNTFYALRNGGDVVRQSCITSIPRHLVDAN